MSDPLSLLTYLIGALQAERDRVQLLYDIARRLTDDLELQSALRSILDLSLAGVAGPGGEARGSILLLDETGRPSDWILIRDLPRLVQREVVVAVLKEGLSGWVVEQRDIALVEDCLNDPRWIVYPDSPDFAGSALAAPLLVEGAVRGVLVLIHPQRYFFGAQHVELMRAISSHAGAVLANALLYRRLEAQVRQLADANRVQSEFIANITHELRTPLNAIIGFTDLIASELSGPISETQREQLGRVLRNAHTLLDLLNTVMDLSKLEAGAVEFQQSEFAVQELVESILSSVALQADERGVQLTVEVDPLLPPLLVGDQGRLGQIGVNLVSNAIKFTPAGTVTLRLHCGRPAPLPAPPPVAIVRPERQLGDPPLPTAGPVWCMIVQDTGIGIATPQQEVVFERFRQLESALHRQAGGAGLGLAIVKKLVEGLHGELTLQSALGAGSRFTVVLPLQRVDPAPQKECS